MRFGTCETMYFVVVVLASFFQTLFYFLRSYSISNMDDDTDESVNCSQCLICQKHIPNATLSQIGENGKTQLLKCAEERQNLFDSQLSRAIIRILKFLKDNGNVTLQYHKSCYASFTSADKISRLKKKCENATQKENVEKNKLVTRSRTGKTDWEKCLICQKEKVKERLRLIMTTNMNDKIMELANYDYKLHVSVSAVGDLIAAEGKYHSSCLLSLQQLKDIWKDTDTDKQKEHLPLIQICKELRVASSLDQASIAVVLRLK